MVKTHNHAFFVYGVIVGLAIREALTRVVPHTIPYIVDAPPQLPDPRSQVILEVARLVTFLAVIIRFYLGAGMYFDRVYCSEKSADDFKRKNYGFDFLLGTIHFIILFILSQTIVGHNRLSHGMSGFSILMGIVLLYDLVWWGLSSDYDTVKIIKPWAVLNALSVVVSLLLIVVLNLWEIVPDRAAEVISLLPVGFLTLVDFGEMFGGKNVLTSAILATFKPDDTQT